MEANQAIAHPRVIAEGYGVSGNLFWATVVLKDQATIKIRSVTDVQRSGSYSLFICFQTIWVFDGPFLIHLSQEPGTLSRLRMLQCLPYPGFTLKYFQ
jgi:hypothetical protein